MPSDSGSGFERHVASLGDIIMRIGKRVEGFWQRVTEGIAVQVLWSQFMSEARASYSLYTREVDWETLRKERRGRRFKKITSALFWAMLMKLSPARRVFLLIALLFAILALTSSQVTITISKNTYQLAQPNNFLSVLLSVAALLFLLALELADRVTMKRDLEIAREIQRWLVPESPPEVPGVEIAFVSRPANTVGGDYYDAFLRGTPNSKPNLKRLMLVVADVAGKSVPAALLMATFQASLRTLAEANTSLLELVEGLNRYACAHSLGGRRFTTAFFGELEPETGVLSYVRAGHNAPFIRRAAGSLERLETGDLPLGIDAGARFTCGAATMGPRDLLVIFTDGLIEAVNDADQEFGESRLLALLKSNDAAGAQATLKNLLSAVDAFVGHTRQHDDITCLLLRTD
jgi:sigma-B regulation protein RsbU (phosphoserine phosphatase)